MSFCCFFPVTTAAGLGLDAAAGVAAGAEVVDAMMGGGSACCDLAAIALQRYRQHIDLQCSKGAARPTCESSPVPRRLQLYAFCQSRDAPSRQNQGM